MKTKITILAAVIFMIMTGCVSGQMVAGPNVSILAEIPLAPNVVLTIEAPVIVSPGPNYIWIDGFWTWDFRSRGYIWVQGYWAMVPYQGAFWVPGYWEYYRGGYRWIDSFWAPRNYRFSYGFQNNRFDYFGRPVYYAQPRGNVNVGYAFGYDNRPETRGRGYSSSPSFNDAPRSERARLNREYRSQTNNSVRSANTGRSRQEVIPIRENNANQQSTRETNSTTTRQSNVQDNRGSSTTNSGRTGTSARENQEQPAVNSGRSQSSNRSETPSATNRVQSNGGRQNSESGRSSTYENSQVRSSGSSSPTQSRSTGSRSNSGNSGTNRSR